MYFIFSLHLTCASALPGETQNSKSASLHLNVACFLPKTHETLKYHRVTTEPPFTVKTIDWMHQTGPRILLSVTHMLYVNQVCHGVGRCVKDGNKPEWKSIMSMDSINGISYYLNKCRRYQTHHRWHFYSAPHCSHCKRCTSYGNSVCLSVCPSVCPSHAGIVSKRPYIARCSLRCRVAKCV